MRTGPAGVARGCTGPAVPRTCSDPAHSGPSARAALSRRSSWLLPHPFIYVSAGRDHPDHPDQSGNSPHCPPFSLSNLLYYSLQLLLSFPQHTRTHTNTHTDVAGLIIIAARKQPVQKSERGAETKGEMEARQNKERGRAGRVIRRARRILHQWRAPRRQAGRPS